MITTQQKQQITEALNQYIETHNISANELVKRIDVNESYISSIRKGETTVGKSTIKDKWYLIVADHIGFKLTKEYWEMKETPQVRRIIATLEDAKNNGVTNVIIGQTGSGKTYISDLFVRAYPNDTFKVVISSLDTINDILDKTIDALKIETPKTKGKKLNEIAKKLKQLKLEGFNPNLIFDECEFMKLPALCSMKELTDALKHLAGITLIGTDQLLDNLEKLRKKNRPGIPQFYRRIKFGIRELPSIDRTYKVFLDGVEDQDLRKFLKQNCDNYGELHDVLVPAMKEADRTDSELTENFVRTILGMPKLVA